MKVLSLLQPWASLVVLGHKKIETRSWNTKHRGELLIHASARKIKLNEGDINFYNHLFDVIPQDDYQKLPYGAIIGKVKLVDTLSTETIAARNLIDNFGQEKAFGDYSCGRYGWLFTDPVLFDKPIPAKGALSLWDYDYKP